MSRLSESLAIVPMMEPKDKTAAAYVSDAVDLSLFNSFTIIISLGAITGNTVLTVYQDATAALATALTTAVAFKYRLSAADFKATTADQWGEPTAVLSTGLTMTATTFDHRLVAIEIDPDTLTTTQRFVAFNMDATGNPLLVSAIGIGESRYPGHLIPTAV